MNNKAVNNSIWLSGLVTGALAGYFLYKNRDKMDGQKEKLKTLVNELKGVALDLKNRLKTTSAEAVNSTKSALESANEN
jgi:hypothetical protein